jgi:hypothetical protein
LSEYQIFGIEDYVYKLPKPPFLDIALVRFLWKFSLDILGGLIMAYSKRELSYQSDILDAFAGVADMARNDSGTELCYGLVSSALTSGMLWRLSASPVSRRTGFPSWSWCGWLGEVVVPTISESLSKWTIKYSWIDWYIYDGNHQFRLLTQKQWQPSNAEQPEETDDELKFLDRFAQAFPLEKRTPQTDDISEYLHTKRSETSASVPQYLALLRKHGFDSTKTNPSSISVKDIQIFPGTSLSKHTLYFKTLSKTVYMSACDPAGRGSSGMCRYVHLYDALDHYLGVAEITHVDVILNSLDVRRHETGDNTQPSTRKVPIHIAILSGPSPPYSETKRNLWLWGHLESSAIQAGTNLRFYQVMLLMRHTPKSCKTVGRIYERVGLGEIPSHVLETLEGLDWEDILLH